MATIKLVPSEINNAAGTAYITVTSASNAYTDTSSTTYATISNTNASTSNRYIYIRGFNFDAIPSNATVNSFTIRFKAYQSGGSTSTSYRPYLCNNTTTLTGNCNVITTTTQTLSFTGVTASWDTIAGYGSDFGIRINCRRNNRNTAATFYIYGAEIEVDYTVPVYHNITVTGDSNNVIPTGTESVLEGTDYEVRMYYPSKPTVTDNNTNVTSSVTEVATDTLVLIPNDYSNTNFTLNSIENAYTDANSDTYTTLTLPGGRTGTLYLNFESFNLPSGATIQSVSAQATIRFSRNGSSSGITASCRMYSGNTAKGSSTTVVSSATDLAKTTFNLTVGSWTASELSNARFYFTATNNASSTQRLFYIYGVSLNVTYAVSGKIYVYTLTNITTDHVIVVTAVASNVFYIKTNGLWVEIAQVYKKVNGLWVLQNDLTTVFNTGTNYKKGD